MASVRRGDSDGYLLCFLDVPGIRSRVRPSCIIRIVDVPCRADGGILGMEHQMDKGADCKRSLESLVGRRSACRY